MCRPCSIWTSARPNWTDSTQLYFKVNNALNQSPPVTGAEPNNTLYDVIGRFYQVGIRINN